MVTGIKVGTEVVASDDPIASTLNLKHALSGNLVFLPLRDGVRRDSETPSKLLLGAEVLEDPRKGSVTHMQSFLHSQLRKRNRQLIAQPKPSVDNGNMVDTPRPEHYNEFKDWLEAVRRSRGLTRKAIAEVAGKTPQAASKWFRGGDVEPEPLRKIADWAGVPYEALRMMLDGQPMTSAKNRKVTPIYSPIVQRISRKVEQLEGDETSITAVEVLVDSLIASAAKNRRRAHRE